MITWCERAANDGVRDDELGALALQLREVAMDGAESLSRVFSGLLMPADDHRETRDLAAILWWTASEDIVP